MDIILSHYGPGVDSASNRNEYQECFLGGKGGQCVRLTRPYRLRVPIVLKSGSLSLLEPSGPVQACNGIALPLLCLTSGNVVMSSFSMGCITAERVAVVTMQL